MKVAAKGRTAGGAVSSCLKTTSAVNMSGRRTESWTLAPEGVRDAGDRPKPRFAGCLSDSIGVELRLSGRLPA